VHAGSEVDANVVATAVEHGAQVLVTNDGQWATALDGLGLPVRVLRLEDFAIRA
jgi:rRNA-processing protein FCF1